MERKRGRVCETKIIFPVLWNALMVNSQLNPNNHCLISNLDWVTMQFSIVAIHSSSSFFLHLPLPSSLIFWLSFHFSHGQNRSFFAPKPYGNAWYEGYFSSEFFWFSVHRLWHKFFGAKTWMGDRVKESKILSKKKNHLKFNLQELNVWSKL